MALAALELEQGFRVFVPVDTARRTPRAFPMGNAPSLKDSHASPAIMSGVGAHLAQHTQAGMVEDERCAVGHELLGASDDLDTLLARGQPRTARGHGWDQLESSGPRTHLPSQLARR